MLLYNIFSRFVFFKELNFFIESANNIIVITAMTHTFVKTRLRSSCWIINFRIASTYHLAGITQDSHWRGCGILSIGNIIPDSIMTGSMNPTADTIRAVSWLLTSVDTNSPIDSESTIYRSETNTTLNMLADTGSPSIVYEISSIISRIMHDNIK